MGNGKDKIETSLKRVMLLRETESGLRLSRKSGQKIFLMGVVVTEFTLTCLIKAKEKDMRRQRDSQLDPCP